MAFWVESFLNRMASDALEGISEAIASVRALRGSRLSPLPIEYYMP